MFSVLYEWGFFKLWFYLHLCSQIKVWKKVVRYYCYWCLSQLLRVCDCASIVHQSCLSQTQDISIITFLSSSLDVDIAPAPPPPLRLAPVPGQVLVLLRPEHVHLSLLSHSRNLQLTTDWCNADTNPEVGVLGRVLGHGEGLRLLLREVCAELVLHHLHLDHLAPAQDGLSGEVLATLELQTKVIRR